MFHSMFRSGDIILLQNGDIVPADARILPGHLSNLQCDEALLTGESLPVQKTTEPIEDATCPVGDRTCMVFAGSQVVKVWGIPNESSVLAHLYHP